jgi:hypothetical protein
VVYVILMPLGFVQLEHVPGFARPSLHNPFDIRRLFAGKGGNFASSPGWNSLTQKEGANFAPSSQGNSRNQTIAANAILWNVEYSASNFFTTGMPSMNFATILSICGYSS